MPGTEERTAASHRRGLIEDLATTTMIACERAAGRGWRHRQPPHNPARWDKRTWSRFLAEAQRQNFLHGARIRQLRRQIDMLEAPDAGEAS
jgi:hypothetical protein